MKQPLYYVGTLILLTILWSIQLCLIKYEHNTIYNILLVGYLYAAFVPLSNITIACLIVMIDSIQFLLTGYFGFITIALTLSTAVISKLKGNFYNKLIMPALCIIGYYSVQYIVNGYILHQCLSMGHYCIAMCITFLMFIFAWWLTLQPMHE